MKENLMEKVVSLCKRRGFVFPGSDIYGGLANTWDYGPYGAALKKNVKDIWWKTFVEDRDDMVGLDAAILMNPTTWRASGHVESFSDPLVDCKECHERFRGDKLLDENGIAGAEGMSLAQITDSLRSEKVPCPTCKKSNWTDAKSFNLMFKTKQGVIEGEQNDIYLRPETAQGIFVNFKNVIDTCRVRVPFGIGQIGKAFRNEITPGNFTYRTREFDQMEIEYFVHPDIKKEKYEANQADHPGYRTEAVDDDLKHQHGDSQNESDHPGKLFLRRPYVFRRLVSNDESSKNQTGRIPGIDENPDGKIEQKDDHGIFQ